MIALAPRLCAFTTIRWMASPLAFSISEVNAETSPPTIVWIPATNRPPTPRVRAVNPVTTPTTLVTRKPGTVGVVTTVIPALMDPHSIGDPHRAQNFSPSAISVRQFGQKGNSKSPSYHVSTFYKKI
jgi:hypothetical protein